MKAADVRTWAETLVGEPFSSWSARTGGRNSRVWEALTLSGRRLAVKMYARRRGDPRQRLDVEWKALAFMRGAGLDLVPEPLAREDAREWAVYTFLPGLCPAPRGDAPDAALPLAAFAATLHGLRGLPGAEALPAASEAWLDPENMARRGKARSDALLMAKADTPWHRAMRRFVRDEWLPLWERRLAQARRSPLWRAPDPREWTLSPSDFGFHNAVLGDDGRWRFIDFEYFGWDDPCKLLSDVLLHPHPAMRLTREQGRRFLEKMLPVYGGDLLPRLALLFPLQGLTWSLIALNAFLRRPRTGEAGELEAQLALARAMAGYSRDLSEWL